MGDADFPTQSRLSNIANVDHELLHFRRYRLKVHSVHPSAANYVFDDPKWEDCRHTSVLGNLAYRRRHECTA